MASGVGGLIVGDERALIESLVGLGRQTVFLVESPLTMPEAVGAPEERAAGSRR